jgi:hypothetical protein
LIKSLSIANQISPFLKREFPELLFYDALKVLTKAIGEQVRDLLANAPSCPTYWELNDSLLMGKTVK